MAAMVISKKGGITYCSVVLDQVTKIYQVSFDDILKNNIVQLPFTSTKFNEKW